MPPSTPSSPSLTSAATSPPPPPAKISDPPPPSTTAATTLLRRHIATLRVLAAQIAVPVPCTTLALQATLRASPSPETLQDSIRTAATAIVALQKQRRTRVAERALLVDEVVSLWHHLGVAPLDDDDDDTFQGIPGIDGEPSLHADFEKAIYKAHVHHRNMVRQAGDTQEPDKEEEEDDAPNKEQEQDTLGLSLSTLTKLRTMQHALQQRKRRMQQSKTKSFLEILTLWDTLGVTEAERLEFSNQVRAAEADASTSLAHLVSLHTTQLDTLRRDTPMRIRNLIKALREEIDELQDEFGMRRSQKRASFADKYTPLAHPDKCTLARLEAHRAERQRLKAESQAAAPVLKLVEARRQVISDIAGLDMDEKLDPSRFHGQKAFERLKFEEELRRKRDEQLPGVEKKLLVAIQQWETTQKKPFVYAGRRLLEDIMEEKKERDAARNAKRAAWKKKKNRRQSLMVLSPPRLSTGGTPRRSHKRLSMGPDAVDSIDLDDDLTREHQTKKKKRKKKKKKTTTTTTPTRRQSDFAFCARATTLRDARIGIGGGGRGAKLMSMVTTKRIRKPDKPEMVWQSAEAALSRGFRAPTRRPSTARATTRNARRMSSVHELQSHRTRTRRARPHRRTSSNDSKAKKAKVEAEPLPSVAENPFAGIIARAQGESAPVSQRPATADVRRRSSRLFARRAKKKTAPLNENGEWEAMFARPTEASRGRRSSITPSRRLSSARHVRSSEAHGADRRQSDAAFVLQQSRRHFLKLEHRRILVEAEREVRQGNLEEAQSMLSGAMEVAEINKLPVAQLQRHLTRVEESLKRRNEIKANATTRQQRRLSVLMPPPQAPSESTTRSTTKMVASPLQKCEDNDENLPSRANVGQGVSSGKQASSKGKATKEKRVQQQHVKAVLDTVSAQRGSYSHVLASSPRKFMR